MMNRGWKTFILIIGLTCALALSGLSGNGNALARAPAETITDEELVRNGGFDQDKTAWATNPIGTHVGDGYGKNGVGMGMQIWPEYESSYGYIYQELYLPTQLTAATLSFDYKFVPQSGAALSGFRARIATDTEDLATALYIDAGSYPGETWQVANYTLTAGELSAVNAAHDADKRVYVIIDLSAQFLYVNVDNVSLRVSGSMDYPTLGGSIAYVGLDGNGYAKTVKRIDPDGSDSQTIWTHPSAFPSTNSIYDVDWKPDAGEVAFSSNHEEGYSAFNSDVYGVQPDGSGLRRITNPPSQAAVDAGGYQMGTVTGKIYNDYGPVTMFQLYIQGAQDSVSVDVGVYQDTVDFTLDNVADLGSSTPYVVFTWSDGGGVCKEFAGAVFDVQAGQTVDAGTLDFTGQCGAYNSESISWKRDGSQVGVDVITPKEFAAAGEALGSDLFSAPLTADELAWSPVNDQILYRNWIISGDSGIYLTTEGGGTGTWLVNDGGAVWVTPAWLPDGSGFVYTLDNYIYEYTISSGQVITLSNFHNELVDNPSLSPDGQYVVFERQTTGVTPIQYDLWILNRSDPVEMWKLTDDGKSQNPDWSPLASGEDTPIGSLNISGDASGNIDTPYTFTATAGPADATQPITYTWQADGQSSVTHTGGDLDDSVSFSWSTGGTKQITVTAQNAANSRTAYHTIDISSGSPANIQINYSEGAPGSYFQVTGNTGSGLMAMGNGNVLVNGQSVGAFTTDASGAFTVALHTSASASEGQYRVSTSLTSNATTGYRLDGDAPPRAQESGTVLEVPDTIAPLKQVYLPLVLRNR